ncbi:mycothiol synthase [Phytoactinopolyspora limicola]|uniref:mycothiol synthase n=1 Tax=Phytoactinopolyspora limicola TaxID=2715536 RepID=UPI001A9CB884|nr:mycothiol synthase [Phytoactinopolyspora limicola]
MHIDHATVFDHDTLVQVQALADEASRADGRAPFSDDLWDHAAAGTTEIALALRPVDQATPRGGNAPLAGAAFAGRQGTRLAAELLVAPHHRGQGHGRALLSQLLSTASGELWIWSHGDHPAARDLARRAGLERARELLQLRRPALLAVPETTPPDGVTIRSFVPGQDEAAWVAANAAAFSWHPEQGHRTIADIRAAQSDPSFDPAGFFLAVDAEGQVLGFHWTKVHLAEGDSAPLGEVYVLGVTPAAQGSGLGSHLTAVGLTHLARQPGVEEIMLYVEGDNTAALHVYERLGFSRHAIDVAYRRTG